MWNMCPNATYGEHYSMRMDGKCSWCGKKVAAKHPAPNPKHIDVSTLTLYYEYFYDPNFGIEYSSHRSVRGKR